MIDQPKGFYITQADGTVIPFYIPHPKQLEFHERTEPNVLFWGGRGSGKSLALRSQAHIMALAHPGFTYCLLRRTYPELQRSHLVHIDREMRLLGGYFHHTDRVAHYPNGSRGFFSHCQNEEDVLNLLSAEFGLMLFDELSTFEWEMFTKLSASVRVPVDSGLTAMVRAATNPLGPSAQEILRYFVYKDITPEEDPDYNPNDWYEIHANLIDNPSLDQDQYRKRFSGLPSHVRKAWVDGEFILENALFEFFPVKDGKPYHVLNEIDLPKIVKAAQIYRVVDMGWFPDPAYCAWIAHLGNRYIVLREKLWYKTIAAEIAEEIKEITKYLGIEKVVTTYCDPTMDINTGADVRTIKDTFELHGVPMDCSVNNRELFASSIHAALAQEPIPGTPRLQIYGKGCPYLVKTIPQQRYNPKKPLAMADHKDDHAVVSLAYFIISSSAGDQTPLAAGSPLRPWMKPKTGENYILGRDNVRDTR